MTVLAKIFGGIVAAIAGITLFVVLACSVLFGSLFTRTEVNTMLTDYSATAENVESIVMEIDAADMKIVKGDNFSVEAKNMPENCFTAEETDGVWKIKSDYKVTKKTYFVFFGWEIPIRTLRGSYDGDDCPKITLTIPEDFNADKLSITLGAGRMTGKRLQGNVVKINVGAGKCDLDRLVVNESASLIVGAGEIKVADLNVTGLDIDCGVGNVELGGCITGKSKVKCGVGRVLLSLTKPESNYSYNVKCGIGNVRIGNNNSISASSSSFGNTSTDNSFTLDCGIGSIEMDFVEE